MPRVKTAVPKCPVTHKVSYQYQILAEQRAMHWQRMDGNKQHAYRCNHCPYWHLSSMTKEQFAKSVNVKN